MLIYDHLLCYIAIETYLPESVFSSTSFDWQHSAYTTAHAHWLNF